jgi:hypothetical protein
LALVDVEDDVDAEDVEDEGDEDAADEAGVDSGFVDSALTSVDAPFPARESLR